MKDLYRVLGVQPDSEDVVIRGAYNALMKKYHPDVYQGDKDEADGKAKELNAAFAVLGNPAERAVYDAQYKAYSAAGKTPHSETDPAGSAARQSGPDESSPMKSPNVQKRNKWPLIVIGAAAAAVAAYVVATHDYRGDITYVTPRSATSAPAKAANATPGKTEQLTIPAKIDWDSSRDGDPKRYIVGSFTIQLSTETDKDKSAIPVLDADYPKAPHLHIEGEAGLSTAAAKLQIIKLDPNSTEALLFITYSGGAHCCTTIQSFVPSQGGWKHDSTGGDAGLDDLPTDIDGDHIPDIVLTDGNFNYTFDSYAGSAAPPQIYNLKAGKFVDVSGEPRYSEYFRNVMTDDQAGCLQHQNGACAAFVALAWRLHLHDWAWQFMLDNYDPKSGWGYPKKCDVDTKGSPCPEDHQVDTTFPESLQIFLEQSQYNSHESGGDAASPSFNCGSVTSDVLRLICSNPTLAAADRNLAAAYAAAKDGNPLPTLLTQDQRDWIKLRNNSPADESSLTDLYARRITYLTALARQQYAQQSGH